MNITYQPPHLLLKFYKKKSQLDMVAKLVSRHYSICVLLHSSNAVDTSRPRVDHQYYANLQLGKKITFSQCNMFYV